ncbi:Strubbelig-receptor family [Thalictrum thalictroides]|uniref:Strubbelig-receptor family n=1 Tax=Thalictrum thalictroides TaxID=46969 RepID=A0A7J6URU6_THATH|nr:Strubbelig-receptor family [Thalictrum thalictroides]
MDSLSWVIFARLSIGFIIIFAAPFSHGFTNQQDVSAMNGLYAALGKPPLPGWIPNGGDPCLEAWQGVQCVDSNITSIILVDANLGGELGDNLQIFTSLVSIDLSNNHIGGSIPSTLPLTVKNFFLSANLFNGSIPSSLFSLTQLTDMSLNNNLLTGEIPDSFQTLTGLINLHLSGNNLTGELPPSFENLSSLVTLHLEDNQLSGTLDVLQDLPLRDLDIENNLFSGQIPEKLLDIPNFKMDGNPFNTTTAPVPSPPSPSPPPSSAPPPPLSGTPAARGTPGKQANGPSTSEESHHKRTTKFWTTKKFVWIAIAVVLVFIIIALGIILLVSRCCKERQENDKFAKIHERTAYRAQQEKPKDSDSLVQPHRTLEKVPKEAAVKSKEEHGIDFSTMAGVSRQSDEQENVNKIGVKKQKDEHEIDMSDVFLLPPPPPPPPPSSPPPLSPPPPPPFLVERVTVEPIARNETTPAQSQPKISGLPTSVRSFTIASLQQYTNSFSQENFIGGGMLGSVYRAELPDGKLLAVKKLDNAASRRQNEEQFLELVLSISKLRHANIVELMGYCAEHGQRLLIYEYCSIGTLHDALHMDDELNKNLSWNGRIKIALGAARALEFLHEVCQPPIVHRNFKSANVLLDDGLMVRVSDCGLAPLISSGSVSQLSGQLLSAYGYGAPEFEMGAYTYQSDIYSFGVVMLELLTGRKSHDRSRPRGEQFLVRWAIPQLHDIDALSRMVDPSLRGFYPVKSLSRFADIISLCVQSEPEFRPPMSEIVKDLLYLIQRELPKERSERD